VNITAVAKLKFTSKILPLAPDFSDCLSVLVLQPIVTETEPTNFIVRLSDGLVADDVKDMYDPESPKRITCYGIVRYQDVFGKCYKTTFGYHRRRVLADNPDGFEWVFIRDNRGYNRHI